MNNIRSLKQITELKAAGEETLHLQRIMAAYELVIFLDYDGTLTPVSPQPENAFLPTDMRETLVELSKCFEVIVISGRDKHNVEHFVNLPNLLYIGNHGLDMEQPEGAELKNRIEQSKLSIQSAREEIFQTLSLIAGVQIEPKKFTTAIHYRHAKEEEQKKVIEITQLILQKYPALKIIPGKKVLDICPNIDWNKGRALLWVLSEKFKDKNIYPIYIGDDITDESAFFALPPHGMGILVGDHGEPTYADFWLKSPVEVKLFLQNLISNNRNSR